MFKFSAQLCELPCALANTLECSEPPPALSSHFPWLTAVIASQQAAKQTRERHAELDVDILRSGGMLASREGQGGKEE